MITEIEDYFTKGCGRCARFTTPDCSTRLWAAGLAALRRICLGEALEETVKWGHPCYMHAGRNVALLGAFRGDFRISFFEAGLLKDEAGLLEASGPNSRHPDMIRFTENEQAAARAPQVRALLRQGMENAAAGQRAPREPVEIVLPDEFVHALDGDPELAEAFERLTQGRKRSYAIALGSAKTAATRVARIVRFRDRILAGKGATER